MQGPRISLPRALSIGRDELYRRNSPVHLRRVILGWLKQSTQEATRQQQELLVKAQEGNIARTTVMVNKMIVIS
jgi:hypothetical protein